VLSSHLSVGGDVGNPTTYNLLTLAQQNPAMTETVTCQAAGKPITDT
jgi:hypothetical protein